MTSGDSSDPETTSTASTNFQIVGIGASAGGLESLERLFANLPADTGMAFVVLQHLSPDFRSLMDELLGRRTAMRIRQAESDMPVEPDTVYLLPPMKEMIIRQRQLLLNDKDPRLGLALPIDMFLRSLAQDVGDRAIAVILSGSGSDGSRGVQEISKAGGTVFCESPDTAQFNGMPLSAMRSGKVDQVLSPEEIAAALAALGRRRSRQEQEGASSRASDPERGIDAIVRLLRDEYAIDFSHYKASTVVRRIERRLALNRSLDVDMYVEQVRADPRELSSLYEDLLIGVTRFFRDDEAFAALEQQVIPDLLERTPPEEPLRVWVPGCATGQEAYSIAILLHEALSARNRPVNMKILATDVHKASLDVASAGLYAEDQIAGVNSERLQRFFTPRANGYQIVQALRECIVFAPHNLIRDAPFTNLDLISCRNLLIYFQPHAQKTVLTLFHFALKPGGFLLLGSSESPGGLVAEFDTIDDRAKVFRKLRNVGLPRDLKLPLPRRTARPSGVPAPRSGVSAQLMSVYDRLLDQFMPPSLLVDDQGHLVDTFGGFGALLKIKSRRPSQYVPEMLPDELRAVASSALHRARKDLESVRYPGVHLAGRRAEFSLIAQPYRDGQGNLTHVLLSLGEAAGTTIAPVLVPPFVDVPTPRPDEASGEGSAGHDTASRDRILALEEELAYAKEHLQSAIEEHETSNEELQATNEELIAANEELQSTNEELHSVNEELYTVNAEYQRKNAELQELNDDIEHLLNGTDVATLFLDRDLCIRKFTPRISDTFRILPQDVGRPLQAFAHDLLHPTLVADLERVLREGSVVEAQTWDRHQRCYFLRILPYRARARERGPLPVGPGSTERNAGPDGVLLTLTDISALEQARARLAQLSAIVESSDDAIIGKTVDGVITAWNRGATRLYGYAAEDIIGRHASVLYPPGCKEQLDEILREIRTGRSVEHREVVRVRQDGSLVHVSVTYSPIYDRENVVTGVSVISRDITQLVRARQEIAEREGRIRLLLDSTAEAIYGVDLSGACIFCNSACARLLGYETPDALVGRQIHPLVHHTRPDGTPNVPEQSAVFEAMRRREGVHVEDEVLWRADRTSFPAEYWSHPIVKDDQVIGAVVTFIDITARRETERELQEAAQRREHFLAMLSHELRNPLAAILSATRLLEREASLNDACRHAGQVVQRQARHMARLLDDLLDVARVTHGRITLHTEVIDVRDTARAAIEAVEPLFQERETHLVVDMPEEAVPVLGDPARLQQIQANLLSNASKYSPRGSEVRLTVRAEQTEAVICVADDGRGIAAETLPRIFEPFVQGHESTDRSQGGLGIGLTLLRSLVELHHGCVEAQSDGPGRGSTFTVRLPLALGQATSDLARRPQRPVRTVVVVEDQDDAREMMKILLESYGLSVHTAANGADGVELIRRVRPDLAFVDLGLPVMSGFELARQIRRMPHDRWIRLVALSGYGQESDVREALEAGFDEHLTKPTDAGRLEQLILPRDAIGTANS